MTAASNVIRLPTDNEPVSDLRMLTAEDVQAMTGLSYRAALELMHVHGLRIKGMWRISEARLRRVLG